MLPLVPEVLLAEDRVDRMLEDQARQWWERQNLHETGMSLSQVVLDYQFQVCAYIVQRLRDPATPAEIRDAFAMRGMPNLGVVLKHGDVGTTATAGVVAGPLAGAAQPETPAPNVSSVLEAYRIAGKLPQ